VSVVVVGANHRTASLDLLERMVVTGDRLPKLLHDLDSGPDVSEVAVLATCNRTEVYLVAERFHGAYSQVRDFFGDLTYLPPDLFSDSLYVHYDASAVRHLFEVAAGLDSAVPGEHEILGQVRDAWEAARAEGTARRSLNLLFRQAVEVGKRARTETRIARHVTSVSQAAVLLAGDHFAGADSATEEAEAISTTGSGLAGRSAVLVGAGTMARGMASFLVDAGVSELVIANRTPGKADELAASIADRTSSPEQPGTSVVRGIGLDRVGDALARADVLLTATNAAESIVSVEQVAGALDGRAHPLLVVDVGVPRDVDPAVAALEGVEVLDMDAVAAMTEASLAARHAEADAVRGIVAEELERFDSLVNAREVAPVVTALREQAERIRAAELDRFAGRLDGLDAAQRDAVEALTRGMLAKLLHEPTVRLKGAAGSTRGDRLADSVRDLFDLG
jgi:glutamyl-tRNA reductase